MKQCLIMKKNQKYDIYQFFGSGDWRFAPLTELFSPYRWSNELIDWFYDEKRTSFGNELISIDKKQNFIVLYDTSDQLDETYVGPMRDPAKRFEMTRENFLQIIHQWEELRISRPDIILVVIHEDNHVSLETDQKIIKEYQDAGYALDINK